MSLARMIEEQRDGIKKLNAEVNAGDCFSGSVRWVVVRRGLLMDSCGFGSGCPVEGAGGDSGCDA